MGKIAQLGYNILRFFAELRGEKVTPFGAADSAESAAC